jgi:hypothetical protein
VRRFRLAASAMALAGVLALSACEHTVFWAGVSAPPLAASWWSAWGGAGSRLGMDGRILQLGRQQLGVAAGAMGAAAASGECLAETHLRALP